MPNNLPASLSPFVGRVGEIADVKSLVQGSRMVTLTGAGGSGKTRLALQAAAEMLDGSGEGVWLVELAQVSDGSASPDGDPRRPPRGARRERLLGSTPWSPC